MNQPQNKLFKHTIIAALVISLGGISFASFADTVASAVTPTTTTTSTTTIATTTTTSSAPSAEDHAARKARWEAYRAEHKQERTQRRTEMFQQADTNHDGKVSLAEWLAFKPHRHHDDDKERDQPHARNLDEWLKKVDVNHDGQISKAEAESYAPRIAKHFDEIDTDHNGLISSTELQQYFAAKDTQREQRMSEHRTEEFKKADTNHDGQLTLEEWLAFKPHHHSFWQRLAFWHHGFWGHHHHGHGDSNAESRFKTLDTNHDGSISLSEAQAGAPQIAEHFNEIDTDHNGQISQDELRAYFKAQHEKSQS
jgi:Ca2+-binding EF-hand superfamily protein